MAGPDKQLRDPDEPTSRRQPPASAPLWRRIAQGAGVDDEIDQVLGSARAAGDWLRQYLPQLDPELAKMHAERIARDEARRKAEWEALTRVASAPGRALRATRDWLLPPDEELAERYAPQVEAATGAVADLVEQARPAWTPHPLVAEAAERQKRHIRDNIAMVADAAAPVESSGDRYRAAVETARDVATAVPEFAVDLAADATTPVGMATNLFDPAAPALKFLAPAAKFASSKLALPSFAKALLGGGDNLAAMLLPAEVPGWPGFYSRAGRVAEQIPVEGLDPGTLLRLLKNNASAREIGMRKIEPWLKGLHQNARVTREMFESHLEQNPLLPLSITRLGEGENPVTVNQRIVALGHPSLNYHNQNVPGMTQPGGYRENLFRYPELPEPPELRQMRDAVAQFEDRFAANPALRWDVNEMRAYGEQKDLLKQAEETFTAMRRYAPSEQPNAPPGARPHADYLAKHFAKAWGGGSILPEDYWNTLYHTRTDPKLIEGKLGQLVLETQSDMLQPGVEQGYRYGFRTPRDFDPAFQQQLHQQLTDAGAARDLYRQQHADAFVTPEFTPPTLTEYFNHMEVPPQRRVAPYLAGREAEYQQELTALRDSPERYRDFLLRQWEQTDPGYRKLQKDVDAARMRWDALVKRRADAPDDWIAGTPPAYGLGQGGRPDDEMLFNLAMRQHLLESARNPAMEWFGLAGGKMESDLYAELLNRPMSRIRYNPATGQLEGWHANLGQHNPAYGFVDAAQNIDRTLTKGQQLEHFIGVDQAEQMQALMAQGAPDAEGFYELIAPPDQPFIVPGAGMLTNYDDKGRKRLEKIIAPFKDVGARVVQAFIPGTRDYYWRIELPEPVKRAILERGFEFMALPLGAGVAGAAALSQQPGGVGAPPPVFTPGPVRQPPIY